MSITVEKLPSGGYHVRVVVGDRSYNNVVRNKKELAQYLATRAIKPIPGL